MTTFKNYLQRTKHIQKKTLKTKKKLLYTYAIKYVANKANELTKDTGLKELFSFNFGMVLNADDIKTINNIF